jgi:uncharacterized membrane protein
MNAIKELEAAVQRLSPQQRAEFRAWFEEFDAADWDRQLEADAREGRLDWLLQEGLQAAQDGSCLESGCQISD